MLTKIVDNFLKTSTLFKYPILLEIYALYLAFFDTLIFLQKNKRATLNVARSISPLFNPTKQF